MRPVIVGSAAHRFALVTGRVRDELPHGGGDDGDHCCGDQGAQDSALIARQVQAGKDRAADLWRSRIFRIERPGPSMPA